MSVTSGIAGGAISSGLSNIMSFADAFHNWEYDYRKTGIVPYLDPGGTFLGYLNNRAEKRAAKKQREWAEYQAALEYGYQKRAALEMPGLLRQGFEDAGYNALLALGQTGGATNAVPNVDAGQYPHQIERRNRDANLLVEGAISQQEAQIEKIKSETTRNKIHNITDVITSLVGTLGGFYGLRQLLKNKKLQSAMTANAAKGSPVHRVAATAAAGASAGGSRLLSNLGKFGSAASLVGLTALVNELGNIAQSKGLPSKVTPSAEKKAHDIRYGKPSRDLFNPRNLNFDSLRKRR